MYNKCGDDKRSRNYHVFIDKHAEYKFLVIFAREKRRMKFSDIKAFFFFQKYARNFLKNFVLYINFAFRQHVHKW